MSRMLKIAYYKLKQCVIHLNNTVSDLEKANKQAHRNKEDFTTLQLSEMNFSNLGKITKPCYDVIEKRWDLQKVPIQINKSADLTDADFSPDEKANISTCLNEMSAFNAWLSYIEKDSKYMVNKSKKLVILKHDAKNRKYIIRTPNVYLERYTFPKLSKCKVLNDLFETKPQ